jgi:hypothetical protein
VAETAQGLKGRVLRKNFILPIESWFLTFFHFYFLLMVLHDVTFNVTATIQIEVFNIFSRNFTRPTVLKVWIKSLINKKNFSSLIITNMELRHESLVPNLIWKWGAKDPKNPKKREDHLIYINFGVKKFIVKNTQKNKTLMFEWYNLLFPMEWGAAILLRFILNKVTLKIL